MLTNSKGQCINVKVLFDWWGLSFLFFLVFLFLSCRFFAEGITGARQSVSQQTGRCFLTFRGAYFDPTGGAFRKVYSSGAIYGFEFDYQIENDFYGWAAINYFNKTGKTTAEHCYTDLSMLPITIGLKWLYRRYRVQPYIGLGLNLTYLHEITHDPTLAHVQAVWNAGGIAKTGLFIRLVDEFLIEFYADYSFSKVRLHRSPFYAKRIDLVHSANLSGFSFGTGLGYEF